MKESTPLDPALKPCPFCGAEDEVSFGISHSKLFDEVRTHHHVECMGCGVMGPTRDSDEEALEDWNTRPKPKEEGGARDLREALESCPTLAALTKSHDVVNCHYCKPVPVPSVPLGEAIKPCLPCQDSPDSMYGRLCDRHYMEAKAKAEGEGNKDMTGKPAEAKEGTGKPGPSASMLEPQSNVGTSNVGTPTEAPPAPDLEALRKALLEISDKLPCDMPCDMDPKERCNECGHKPSQSWCAGCVARAALAVSRSPARPLEPTYFERASMVCSYCRQVEMWHGKDGKCPPAFPVFPPGIMGEGSPSTGGKE